MLNSLVQHINSHNWLAVCFVVEVLILAYQVAAIKLFRTTPAVTSETKKSVANSWKELSKSWMEHPVITVLTMAGMGVMTLCLWTALQALFRVPVWLLAQHTSLSVSSVVIFTVIYAMVMSWVSDTKNGGWWVNGPGYVLVLCMTLIGLAARLSVWEVLFAQCLASNVKTIFVASRAVMDLHKQVHE